MSNLVLRILSGLVAFGVLGLGIYCGVTGIFLLCLLASAISLFEFSALWSSLEVEVNPSSPKAFRYYFLAIGVLFFLSAARYPEWVFFLLPVYCALLSGPTIWFLAKKENLAKLLKVLGMSVLGIIYCGLMPSISYQIARLENGVALFGLHVALVFSGDIFAYFSGRFFGSRKLHETLSPKKTLEGAFGGLAGSILAGMTWVYFARPNTDIYLMLALFLVTGFFAQLGDLFKSFFKRFANVKDSGGIMPGHGGILDRIDGVLFSSAFFYAFILLLFKP